jgi:hypothetical protein
MPHLEEGGSDGGAASFLMSEELSLPLPPAASLADATALMRVAGEISIKMQGVHHQWTARLARCEAARHLPH